MNMQLEQTTQAQMTDDYLKNQTATQKNSQDNSSKTAKSYYDQMSGVTQRSMLQMNQYGQSGFQQMQALTQVLRWVC